MRERTRVLPAASSSLARAMNLLPAFPRWRDSVVHGVVNQLGERVHSQLVDQLRPLLGLLRPLRGAVLHFPLFSN